MVFTALQSDFHTGHKIDARHGEVVVDRLHGATFQVTVSIAVRRILFVGQVISDELQAQLAEDPLRNGIQQAQVCNGVAIETAVLVP